jgi:ribosomal protein S13
MSSNISSEVVTLAKNNLPANINIVSALSRVKGVGHNSALVLLRSLGISESISLKEVSKNEFQYLTDCFKMLEDDKPIFTEFSGRPMSNKISACLSLTSGRLKEDLLIRNNYHKKLRGYRGRQKLEGLKCRHQRSKATGRKHKKVVKKK